MTDTGTQPEPEQTEPAPVDPAQAPTEGTEDGDEDALAQARRQ